MWIHHDKYMSSLVSLVMPWCCHTWYYVLVLHQFRPDACAKLCAGLKWKMCPISTTWHYAGFGQSMEDWNFVTRKWWNDTEYGFTKTKDIYFDVPDDDALPIGIQEVVAFGIAANHFCNSPLHLRETGKYMFWKSRCDKLTGVDRLTWQ